MHAHSKFHHREYTMASQDFKLPPADMNFDAMQRVNRSLVQETELQKMLTDEKMKSEQYRTNYETLKAEHTRLQDEHIQVQGELRNTVEGSKLMQEKYKSMIEQERHEIASLQATIGDQKSQIVTPQRLDVIRLQVSEDIDRQYRDRFVKLDSDVERHRAEYNKLRYEYSFLKSEYEHEKLENQRIIEELKLQNEAEVLNLRKERENLIGRQQTDMRHDTQKVRQLQRDNAQLHLKMKGLMAELDDLRSQQEHKGLQSDQMTRMQTKTINEHASNLRAIQTERDTLRLQCDNLIKELTSSSDENIQLTNRIHDVEKDNLVLRNRVEELAHRSKIEAANMKMDFVKEKGELERQVDRLDAEVEDLQSQLQIAKQTLEQQSSHLLEKERDAVRRVQMAREEEWEKLTKVEDEKLELETRLQELDRKRLNEESERHLARERMEERIRLSEGQREQAEKENITFRAKLDQHQTVVDQLELERQETASLNSRISRLESELGGAANREQQALNENQNLRHQLAHSHNEVKRLSGDMNKEKSSIETILAEQKSHWMEEKLSFSNRVQELEGLASKLSSKYNKAESVHRKRKQKYIKYTRTLKEKYQILKAKHEHLQMEKGGAKLDSNSELGKLKRQLRDLCRRHEEFRNILMLGTPYNAKDHQKPLQTGAVDALGIVDFNEQEQQHQRDLDLLHKRLNDLQNSQQQQMKDLRMLDKENDVPEEIKS